MQFCTNRVLRCIAGLLFFAMCSVAQETNSSSAVTLTIEDKHGTRVAGAQIKVISDANTEPKTLIADDAGVAAFELQPSTYDLIIKAHGFWPLRRRVVLDAGEQVKLDLVLEVSGCPSENCIVDYEPKPDPELIVQQSRTVTKNIDIKNVQFVSQQDNANKKKLIVLEELRESKQGRLEPGATFDLVCEINGELDLSTEDFLLWTTVDFLVAPATENYERMEIDKLALSISWAQVSEMEDLRAVPIYALHAGEQRRIVVKDFTLQKILASFPPGNAGNLWPWLVRINIYIQDRAGRQVASTEKTFRVWPDPVRLQKHD